MASGGGYGWGLGDVDERDDMGQVVDMNGAEEGGYGWGVEDMDWVADMYGVRGGRYGWGQGWGTWMGDERYIAYYLKWGVGKRGETITFTIYK